MLQIRQGVFETNSSSTHSICICTEEDYQKFRSGEKLFDTYGDCLVDKEQAEKDTESWGHRYVNSIYDISQDWYNTGSFDEHFTTPSGDKMAVFGVYGYN